MRTIYHLYQRCLTVLVSEYVKRISCEHIESTERITCKGHESQNSERLKEAGAMQGDSEKQRTKP